MTEKEAAALAAQAWCGEGTRNKVVDPELALEFARILRREVDKAGRSVGMKKPYWLMTE